jgi:hypothetical protein
MSRINSSRLHAQDRQTPHLIKMCGDWVCVPSPFYGSRHCPVGMGRTPAAAWCDMWERYLDLSGAIVVLEEPPPLLKTEFKPGQSNEWKGKWRWFR